MPIITMSRDNYPVDFWRVLHLFQIFILFGKSSSHLYTIRTRQTLKMAPPTLSFDEMIQAGQSETKRQPIVVLTDSNYQIAKRKRQKL